MTINRNRFAQPFTPGWSRKVGNNRRLIHRLEPGGVQCIAYTLHGHEVASKGGDVFTLDDCGWPTKTTLKAMREFMYVYGVRGVYPGSKTLRINDVTGEWPGSVTFRKEGSKAVARYIDIEVRGIKVHFRIDTGYTQLGSTPYDIAAGYILAGPYITVENAKAVYADFAPHTKGVVITKTHQAWQYILRGRKVDTRETRLFEKVLLGEAELVSWK